MISFEKFAFVGFQTVGFYNDLRLRTSTVLPRLLASLGADLDGDPISLPIPIEAPKEVPRVILANKDQTLRLDISLARADFRWEYKNQCTPVDLSHFCTLSLRAFSVFSEATETFPGRVALIVRRFQPQDFPGKALAEHFCKPALLSNDPKIKGPFNRPDNFELHAHKVFKLGDLSVNSWVRAKSGFMLEEDNQTKTPGIIIEQDINTLAETLSEDEYKNPELSRFLAESSQEFDTILKTYFGKLER